MKSRLIYIVVAVCVLAVSIGLYQINTKSKSERVHQHKEEEWQGGDKAAEDGFQTQLPIIQIKTGDHRIPGAPISSRDSTYTGDDFELAYNGEETLKVTMSVTDGQKGENKPTDKPELTTYARIRYRGNSSRFFHKKSYAVSLVNKDETENPRSLVGMSSHNEWVLNGPFLDRTLLRNYLCLNISGEIMEYAPNVRYCELFVDGNYQGLYLLMEKISRGDGRINIPKPEKNSDVTSYLVRWDRAGKGEHELDNYTRYTYKSDVSALDVRYPGENQITEGRMAYIEKDISKIEKMLYSYDLLDAQKGAQQYLDYDSFAEYFIINEFFRNVDAGRFSTFYYKNARGKLKTCVWDFNNACDNYIDYVWNESGFTMQNAPWFGSLLKDKEFVDLVISKYRQLRRGVLSEVYLLGYIDDTVEWLGDAVDRNYEKWGYVFDMSNYHGMNYLTPVERNAKSYDQAVEQLKTFITDRGDWLDAHIDTLYQYCHESKNVNELVR